MPSAVLAIDRDCPDPDAFAPTVGVTAEPSTAGADTALTAVVERPDRQARLRSMRISLPPGLLGRLTAVPACPIDTARAGACDAASRVGSVRATAGPGAAPLALDGSVFLVGPHEGRLGGLAIVVPARVGPLDLGAVVVVAEIRVRPEDSGLDVIAGELPSRLGGIALGLRRLELRLDRPGFILNATSCAPQQVRASFGSDRGATATAEAPYQATGCEALPFAPQVAARVGGPGQTARGRYPAFSATITSPPGHANLRRVAVTLPLGVTADFDRLGRACPEDVFARNACPPQAVVGTATAQTPLLPTPLTGPVTLVFRPGQTLPELRVQLRGLLDVDLTGVPALAPGGRLATTFEGVPDVPITRFALDLAGGEQGLLRSGADLCDGAARTLDADLAAHSGGTARATVPVRVDGCRTTSASSRRVLSLAVGSLRSGRPSFRARLRGGPTAIRSVTIRLPRGLTTAPRRAGRALRLQGIRGGRVRTTRTTIRVTLPKGGKRSLTLLARRGVLRVAPALRRRGRPRLTFRVEVRGVGATKPERLSVRVRPGRR
jgi:hypothetical protein